MTYQSEQDGSEMMMQSLALAIFIIDKEQRDFPETYHCIEADLDSLKRQMDTVIKYIAPVSEEDLCLSLPVLANNENQKKKHA